MEIYQRVKLSATNIYNNIPPTTNSLDMEGEVCTSNITSLYLSASNKIQQSIRGCTRYGPPVLLFKEKAKPDIQGIIGS